jgi:hypothetical protein
MANMKKISSTQISKNFGKIFPDLKDNIIGVTKREKTQAIIMSYSIFRKLLNRIKKAEAELAKINPEFRNIHKPA